jgi:hypothetical protein
MIIDWCKCILQSRCRLNLINLNNEYFDNLAGVYVIWSGNDKSNIISVGKGIIRDKIIEMQNDKTVQEFGPDLFVTWAAVSRLSLKGVEAFLCSRLNPRIPHSVSDIDLINVNLP